jgi:hypothetical protein
VVQTAESRVRNNATLGSHPNSTARCFLAQSEVGAVVVVVTNIFREQPFQMAFIHGDTRCWEITPVWSLAFTDPRDMEKRLSVAEVFRRPENRAARLRVAMGTGSIRLPLFNTWGFITRNR